MVGQGGVNVAEAIGLDNSAIRPKTMGNNELWERSAAE
jgi:surface antigen